MRSGKLVREVGRAEAGLSIRKSECLWQPHSPRQSLESRPPGAYGNLIIFPARWPVLTASVAGSTAPGQLWTGPVLPKPRFQEPPKEQKKHRATSCPSSSASLASNPGPEPHPSTRRGLGNYFLGGLLPHSPLAPAPYPSVRALVQCHGCRVLRPDSFF